MKKYKLVKEYPESPKIGTEIIKSHVSNNSSGCYDTYMIKGEDYFRLPDPENYPEFWELVVEYPIGTKVHNSQTNTIYTKKKDGWYKPAEKTAYTDEMIGNKKHLTVLGKFEKVVEKDYEILSYIHNGSKHIWKKDPEFETYFYINQGLNPCTRLEDILKYPKIYLIHSIKRKSDGEVFTVGDKVVDGNIINEFELIDNKLKVWTVHPSYTIPIKPKDNGSITGCGNMSFNWLNNIKKFKQKLFTTEEGVEKDYEILSLICDIPSKTIITYENGGGNSYQAGNFEKIYKSKDKWLHSFAVLNANIWKIHSVKRLSDSEIFTVGDKVFSEYVNYTINKISIVNDKCMVSALYDTNNPNGSRLHYNLNNLKKAKQPLFTTEDGVDIFEDDEVVCFDKEDWITRNEKYKFQPFDVKDKNYLFFSTKEKAEEYILMNKPCLSLLDIFNSKAIVDSFGRNQLVELVKQKK